MTSHVKADNSKRVGDQLEEQNKGVSNKLIFLSNLSTKPKPFSHIVTYLTLTKNTAAGFSPEINWKVFGHEEDAGRGVTVCF